MKKTSKDDYRNQLEKTGVIAFVPGGNSMWPTLKNRKQSVIVKKKDEKLKKMDVALYKRANGSNVLHRVIETTDFGYIICGDSQFTLEKVAEDQVYGVMVGFYRGKNYIDVTDQKYIDEITALYADDEKRRKRVKRFFFFQNVRTLPNRAIAKLLRILKKTDKNAKQAENSYEIDQGAGK